MSDVEKRYHETWLGMVQPIEGLVLSVPVLVDTGVMERTTPDVQERFRAHLVEGSGTAYTAEKSDVGEKSKTIKSLRVRDLSALLRDVLGFEADAFDVGDRVDPALSHYVPEGKQKVTPTMALRTPGADPALPVAERTELLVWQVPDGLSLDRAETVTGTWEYPPQAKLDRVLRAVSVPMGLLCNGESFRLVYAPRGESTGAITFRVDDMASVGGRPILDAFLSLLSARRFFLVAEDRTLRALLTDSRKRQANVTNALAEQVFEALDTLLHGFEAAAERDGTTALREAMQADGEPGEHIYGGLLTSMLRLVFLLYAEDRGLMPMERGVYAQHLSVLGLFDQLQQDAGLFPDTMSRRFGAWPRLLALFRAVYEGADATSTASAAPAITVSALHMPARRGRLFDPNTYPFLEGWTHGGAAPHTVESRSQVQAPSIDDETVYRVLDKLLLLDGQRLSYRALDVEQIGSVYEALMGYRVLRLVSPAACLRDSGVWLETERVLAESPGRREALVVEESGLAKGRVAKIADALKAAKTNDDVLAALESLRKSPKHIAIRQPGALALQPGPERRRTSSHYTPRSLSAPIVEKTLRPLLATMAASPGGVTAERLLELKVCDPAMGSGAFLVEACRFLADEVVKAWTAEGTIADIEARHGEPLVYARRLVAQRCLYGVDKNPYAVNLAKLSLWLVSLAKDEPFTFVDHALRWGDSLVGLSLEQLRRFHWSDQSSQDDWIVDVVTKDLDEAMVHRQRILELARSHGAQTAREKEDLLRDADDAAKNARLLADILVGAFFAHDKDKDREKERTTRLTAAQSWVSSQDPPTEQLLRWQREMHAATPPFHWPIEFPEVFYAGRPDPLDAEQTNRAAWMDAFVGNPPFMHGLQLARAQGSGYSSWITATMAGTDGRADLVAHFFVQACSLLGAHGAAGFVATNTISQGDTRESGLANILRRGFTIYSASSSVNWPGAAAVVVSIVHLACGRVSGETGPPTLNGRRVASINSRLRPGHERVEPRSLLGNADNCFLGSHIYGGGFVLDSQEREDLIRVEPSAKDIIFPYMGGEELNSSPTQEHDRYVINFGERSLEEAERWPSALAIVRERVKPYRDGLKETALSAKLQQFWWRFYSQRLEMHVALAPLGRCLAISGVTKHLVVAWQPTNRVFSHALYIFSFEDDAHFAVLQSRIHEAWSRLLSSSMKTDLRYAPSDCFENFPFPRDEFFGAAAPLSKAGVEIARARGTLMVATDQGLTKTYNRLKDPGCADPRILALRRMHEDMDRAVLDAYGWTDVVVPPYCPLTDADKKAVEAFEDEVIDRLFALNAERAREEELLGLGGKKPPKPKAPTDAGAAPKKAGRKKKPEPDEQGGLF